MSEPGNRSGLPYNPDRDTHDWGPFVGGIQDCRRCGAFRDVTDLNLIIRRMLSDAVVRVPCNEEVVREVMES
jgi:hypothetical protein